MSFYFARSLSLGEWFSVNLFSTPPRVFCCFFFKSVDLVQPNKSECLFWTGDWRCSFLSRVYRLSIKRNVFIPHSELPSCDTHAIVVYLFQIACPNKQNRSNVPWISIGEDFTTRHRKKNWIDFWQRHFSRLHLQPIGNLLQVPGQIGSYWPGIIVRLFAAASCLQWQVEFEFSLPRRKCLFTGYWAAVPTFHCGIVTVIESRLQLMAYC